MTGPRGHQAADRLTRAAELVARGIGLLDRFTDAEVDAARLAGPHRLGCPALGADPDGIDECECEPVLAERIHAVIREQHRNCDPALCPLARLWVEDVAEVLAARDQLTQETTR